MSRAFLVVNTRGSAERLFPLGGERVSIGRAADNDLAIADLSLSRLHAVIVRQGDRYLLSDRGSRNGTLLNDRPVTAEAALRDGDIVRLGDTTLQFRDTREPSVAPEPAGPLGEGSVAIPAHTLLQSTLGGGLREVQLLRAMQRASELLIARAGEREVCEEVLGVCLGTVGAERGALMLLEGEPPELALKAVRGPAGDSEVRVSRTIARAVLEEQSSVITTDASSDIRFDAAQSVSLQGIRSAMCVPLWHAQGVAGLLYVDRRFSSRQFSRADLALLTVLANLTAAKIENLRLLEQARLKQKLEEEMRLASDIQRSLLPDADPQVEGWSFCGLSLAARAVGGDLYDYLPLSDGRLALVVADVSGKGVSAALLVAALQAQLRAFAQTSSEPAAIARRVNRALHRPSRQNRFATLCLAAIDPASGEGELVSAGHEPPLIARRDGRIEAVEARGLILGAFADAPPYQPRRFRLEPGDLLVLYSDGVTEAECPSPAAGEDPFFAGERLAEVLRAAHDEPPAAVRDAVLEAIHAHTRGQAPGDDTTLLLARRD